MGSKSTKKSGLGGSTFARRSGPGGRNPLGQAPARPRDSVVSRMAGVDRTTLPHATSFTTRVRHKCFVQIKPTFFLQ